MASSSPSYRRRILLVEDDPAVRRSLQLLLRAQDYDVRAYGTGHALSQEPEALKADCLVADLVIPDTNGLNLLTNLRAAGWNGPAILISGHIDDVMKLRAQKCGFLHIFEKPFSENLLIAAVRRLI